MYGIGIAEEVVHITEDFLVCSHKEHSEIVWLVLAHGVYGQDMRYVAVCHEVGYLAVAVAGDVLYRGAARRSLVESLQRNDREELVYGPAVGQRLEEGEVAEILVGKQLVEFLQFLWLMLEGLCHTVYLAAYAPVHPLYLGTCLKVYHAMAEEVECLLAYLLGVVPVFHHGAWVEVVPDFVEVFHELVGTILRFELLVHLRQ